MKTAICAIAKHENVYINDWVNYHLNLGFDHIYIYDDNEDDYPYVGDCIDNKEKVTIIKFNYEIENHIKNVESSYDFLMNYSSGYDWCAIIDIDEYIYLNNKTIKEFLSNAPNNCNFIALEWNVYTDGNCIFGDEKIPVFERFTDFKTSNYYKTILRIPEDYTQIIVQNPHSFSIKEMPYDYFDYNFNPIPVAMTVTLRDLEKECHIKHYKTKTLSEFIKYKYPRFSVEQGSDAFEYYFLVNEKTPEKIAYIKEKLNIDIQ